MSEQETQQPIETLIAHRRAKLEQLLALGCDPYPARFRVETSVSEARRAFDERSAEELEGEKPRLRLAGRLRAIRLHGKAAFADLSDGSSQIQLYLRRQQLGEDLWKVFEALDLGDFVGVEGVVFRTRAGELSVAVDALQILSKALRPLPEKYRGLRDVEARARQRYLDLIANPASREVFERRSRVVGSLRRFLEGHGFLEVETPIMQPIPGRCYGAPVHHPPQHIRPRPLPADRPGAVPQASDRRRLREGLRAQPQLPQRGDLDPPQPRVHHARVLLGLCRLRAADGLHRGAGRDGGDGDGRLAHRAVGRARARPGPPVATLDLARCDPRPLGPRARGPRGPAAHGGRRAAAGGGADRGAVGRQAAGRAVRGDRRAQARQPHLHHRFPPRHLTARQVPPRTTPGSSSASSCSSAGSRWRTRTAS